MTTQLKEKLNNLIKERGLTMEKLKKLLMIMNDPWEEVKGILKNRKIDAVKYQKKIRQEWGR